MSILDFALEHARQGRLVFPGAPNSKLPGMLDPYAHATTNEATIISWWQTNPHSNICLPGGYEISPGRFLGFVDVDRKNEKNGFQTMANLDILGFEFPETLAQETPSGGLHLFYYFDFAIKNGVNSLGHGLDTRGYHGYVLGAGSKIGEKVYRFKNQMPIVNAPEWLAAKCHGSKPELVKLQLIHNVDQETALGSGIRFLQKLPPAREGERNQRAYEAICRLKDFGINRESAFEVMLTHWKSEPQLDFEELNTVINSAYSYSQNKGSILAPEVIFDVIQGEKTPPKPRHPVEVLNDRYAIIVQNGVRIIREKIVQGKPQVDHLKIQHFHDIEANNLVTIDDKTVAVSKMWMKSTKRRQYEGILFAPNFEDSKRYNIWKGFAVGLPTQPPKPEAVKGLELLLDHIRENVCGGNEEWANWVLGFFAHLIQKPEKKPRVALVLRGRKGVGKNVITDCIFKLLGDYGVLTANRRYLSGNFNAHLENKLMLVLDEAFWSGDKSAEGILKDLITGSTHQIERKGHDSYPVANLMRVVIFGNEEWIVPATDDERRFAVFNVGDGQRENSDYFGAIKDGILEHGGDELLFEYLMNFDLSKVDVNKAPATDALMSQKEHSLGLIGSWWLSCLQVGSIVGSSNDEWPLEMPKDQLRAAFYAEMKAQNVRVKLPNTVHFGRLFNQMAPSSSVNRRKREGNLLYLAHDIAPLEAARGEWEKFIRGSVKWDMI